MRPLFPHVEDDDNSKAASSKREIDRQKSSRQKLERLLDEPIVDWKKIRSFMHVEGVNPNYVDLYGITTAHSAAHSGEVEILRWCVRMRADVNARSNVGRTVLHHACDGNCARCIRYLLEQRADVNIRTLGHATPLHISCMYNSYDAVAVLLRETDQVFDIDAEDEKRKIPEALTTDSRIRKLIQGYRDSLEYDDEMNKLIDTALHRLFNLFDRNGDKYIQQEEWADTISLMLLHFEHRTDHAIEEVFLRADENKDGRIDLEEFKAAHREILEASGLAYRDVLHNISDIEQTIFQQQLLLQRRAASEDVESTSPVISTEAKALSLRRARSLKTTTANDVPLVEDVNKSMPTAGESFRFQDIPILS